MAEIEIKINGESRQVPEGLTLQTLMAHLGIEPGTVVVERRRTIYHASEFAATALTPGDCLEIVRFLGGG